MPKLYVKNAGSWKQVLQLYVKQSGVWKGVTAGLVVTGGIGKQFYPDTTGTTTYPTAGSFSYVVPAGVTSITTTIVGGGGGGGGQDAGGGDTWGGGGGGSGGYYSNQTVAVTPGETLTITVGGGGYAGYDGYWRGCPGQGLNVPAANGASSQLNRGATVILQATGGVRGNQAPGGDNGPGAPGAGGSPNGVAGGYQNPIQRNSFSAGPGGNNPTGYGRGGNGNSSSVCPTAGSTGFVSITPLAANFQNYTTPGSYSFVVPAGVTSLTASVYGAGGGAGSIYFCGDGWVGGGGSSGGYLTNQTFAVTPGETLNVVCGVGGPGGFVGGSCQAGQNGTAGGSTYVARGATNLAIATGGGGGGVGLGSNGAAGSPNGVQGQQPCNPGNCGYGFTGNRAGGQNGTGYGNGATAVFAFGTQASGSNGALFLSW